MDEGQTIKKIQEEFFKRLERKTSWGKEELKKLYLETVSDVVLKVVK